MSSLGEILVLVVMVAAPLVVFQRVGVLNGSFFVGGAFCVWVYTSIFAVEPIDRPLFCAPSSVSAKTVLMYLEDGFDPAEAGLTWKALTTAGHTVRFLTPGAKPASAAPFRVNGLVFQQFFRIGKPEADAYELMLKDPGFRKPLEAPATTRRGRATLDRAVATAHGFIVPGHHNVRRDPAVDLHALGSQVILPLWKKQKAIGALGRGVTYLAPARYNQTGRSILFDRHVFSANEMYENFFYMVVDMEFGVTTPSVSYSSDQLLAPVLEDPQAQLHYAPMLQLDWLNLWDVTSSDARYVKQDGSLITARGPSDALLFAHRFMAMLGGATSARSGHARYEYHKECEADVVLAMELRIGKSTAKRHFVVYKHELGPGRLLSKVQRWVRRNGGTYKSREAMQADVDLLYRSAQAQLEKLELGSTSTSTASAS